MTTLTKTMLVAQLEAAQAALAAAQAANVDLSAHVRRLRIIIGQRYSAKPVATKVATKGYLLSVNGTPRVSYLKASEAYQAMRRAQKLGHKADYTPVQVAA